MGSLFLFLLFGGGCCVGSEFYDVPFVCSVVGFFEGVHATASSGTEDVSCAVFGCECGVCEWGVVGFGAGGHWCWCSVCVCVCRDGNVFCVGVGVVCLVVGCVSFVRSFVFVRQGWVDLGWAMGSSPNGRVGSNLDNGRCIYRDVYDGE